MSKGNRTNHPKKYMRWSDWEAWLATQWIPFRQNDLPHLKADVSWLKRLMLGLIIALIGSAIAILIKG